MLKIGHQVLSVSFCTDAYFTPGRPATGKRSDDAWIGRTYYVKRETDLDVEEELLKLRRQGIDIDKSELVDFLMSAWVKWQQGVNIDLLLDEITPRRKSETDGK